MANNIASLTGSSRAFTVLPSAARTASPDTFEYEGARGVVGLVLVVDATAVTATPALTVSVLGVDRASGKTWTVLASAAIATVSTTILKVRPGLTAAANSVANDALPPVFRIVCSHGDADSITYSVGAHLVF